jgi:hypothetical protein
MFGVVRGSSSLQARREERAEAPEVEPGEKTGSPSGSEPSGALSLTPKADPSQSDKLPEELIGQMKAKNTTLGLHELGTRPSPTGARGALVVRLHYGGSFSDRDRPKFGPGHIDDATILDNTVRYWALDRVVGYWELHETEIPDRIVGLCGPVQERFVISSLQIDQKQMVQHWRETGAVPIVGQAVGKIDLNYLGLRFCRVTDARFSNIPQGFFIWVDGTGKVRAGGRECKQPGS